MSDDVVITERDGVLEITINRADRKNALTSAMYRAMSAAISAANARPEIGTVLLAGRGDDFCAGHDIGDFMAGPEGIGAALDFIDALVAIEKPIVAAVQGAAVGVGTTMLFHCDLIYAAPDARFIMPFVNLGIVPEAGSTLLAPTTIGHAKAAAMLLLGEPMDADTADRSGLVTGIVPVGELLDHARRKASALLKQPPSALLATRRLLRGERSLLTERIAEEARLFREALGSAEAKEAFTAFFERRPPVFRRS